MACRATLNNRSNQDCFGGGHGARRAFAETIGANFIGEFLVDGHPAHQHLHLFADPGLLQRLPLIGTVSK